MPNARTVRPMLSILDAVIRKGRARSAGLSRVSKFLFWQPMRLRAIGFLAIGFTAFTANDLFAAASAGYVGGGFSLLGLSGNQRGAVPAGSIPGSFLVKGKYVEFTVDAATFGVRDWT